MVVRPLYHFTPPQNFMNDPNGLVFYDGEYHLFYQHNPYGNTWGNMSWGHATSRDLLHWENLPVALYEENGVMIFTGSAVVDWQNTSGLGNGEIPPLIAVYTGHSATEQTQNIAFSNDRGRSWIKYNENPLISIGSTEFRDPKVFWDARSHQWILATVLADAHKVRFDGSPDLKHWTHLSDFGPAGAIDGLWECPDLFPLPVEGREDEQHWVLKVDVQFSIGAQYFIGEFDGTRFLNAAPEDQVLRLDYGNDFYAAQSWNDEPDGRRIWLAWMSNWVYANVTPTSPWRGMFTLPRELHLRQYPEGLRLRQEPIRELLQKRRSLLSSTQLDLELANELLAGEKLGRTLELELEFQLETAIEFGLIINSESTNEIQIGYNTINKELFIERQISSETLFSPMFPGRHCGPLIPESGRIKLRIFFDTCSIEIFANDGQFVMSELMFPDRENLVIMCYARGGDVRLNLLDAWKLND